MTATTTTTGQREAGKSATPPTSSTRPTWWRKAAAVAAVVFVAGVHFRPWQGGLLEDWGLALAWDLEGPQGLLTRLPVMLARPLQLAPHYLGLALSDGGFVGPYVVLALVAVGQLLVAVWALRPLTDSAPLRWTAALMIALHPWWVAGDILRFLPAQVAVLALVVWLGAAVRFLRSGGRRWGAIVASAPVVALLTSGALALVFVGGAVLVALACEGSRRRRWLMTGLTTVSVGASAVWAGLLAPALSPATTDGEIAAVRPAESVVAGLRALVLHAPQAVLVGATVGVILIALASNQRLGRSPGLALTLGLAGSPLAVLAMYAAHRNDPERVAYVVGAALWLVLCCSLRSLDADRVVRRAAAGVMAVGAGLVALAGYGTWTAYATAQDELLTAVQVVRQDLPADGRLVVEDQGGRFGDVYLLLPPYLDIALDQAYGDGAYAELCTSDGVVRNHPVADVLPMQTTPDCSTILGESQTSATHTVATSEGELRLWVLPAGDT